MRISLLNMSALVVSATVLALPMQLTFADAEADRIARLEQRLLELEQRLAETEQETKEVKVLASSSAANAVASGNNASILGNAATFDILAGSAWRNLRWTQEEQWEGIKRGISEDQVIDLLGYPPRSVDSLKPRIDKVYWYETSIRDRSSAMRGKISFKKGKVVSFEKPDFSKAIAPVQKQAEAAGRQRLP